MLHSTGKFISQTGLLLITGYSKYVNKSKLEHTQAVIEKMGLSQIAENMIPHQEAFADVGNVQLYIQNMHNILRQCRIWGRLGDTLLLCEVPAGERGEIS